MITTPLNDEMISNDRNGKICENMEGHKWKKCLTSFSLLESSNECALLHGLRLERNSPSLAHEPLEERNQWPGRGDPFSQDGRENEESSFSDFLSRTLDKWSNRMQRQNFHPGIPNSKRQLKWRVNLFIHSSLRPLLWELRINEMDNLTFSQKKRTNLGARHENAIGIIEFDCHFGHFLNDLLIEERKVKRNAIGRDRYELKSEAEQSIDKDRGRSKKEKW